MVVDYKSFKLGDKTVVEKAIMKAPFTMPQFMTEEACFFYVIEGRNQIYGPDEIGGASAKESVLLNCGNFFGKLRADENQEYHALAFHFDPEILKMVYDDGVPDFLFGNDLDNEISYAKLGKDQLFDRFIDGLLFYFENPELVNDDLIGLKVKELLLLLANSKESKKVKIIFRNLFNPRQVAFKKTIETHLYSNLSLDELSQITNNSLSSFKRKFKEFYNESPASYIRSKKLEKAKELLQLPSNSITDVVFECGFNDLSYFSKLFKSEYGLSPSEFQKQY